MKTLFALILAVGTLKSGLTLIERAEADDGARQPWEWRGHAQGQITPRSPSDAPDPLPAGVVALP